MAHLKTSYKTFADFQNCIPETSGLIFIVCILPFCRKRLKGQTFVTWHHQAFKSSQGMLNFSYII